MPPLPNSHRCTSTAGKEVPWLKLDDGVALGFDFVGVISGLVLWETLFFGVKIGDVGLDKTETE